MTPFHVLGSRVLIQADRDDRAPVTTASGLVTATTLAAAVTGQDATESWYVGTVIQVGPRVQPFCVRPLAIRRLRDLESAGHDIAQAEIRALRRDLELAPDDQRDPVRVGDRVIFSWMAGQEVRIDQERYLVLQADEVLAKLD